MTGDLGCSPTSRRSSATLDAKLLLATVVLVLVLLGAIYRAPLIALIPIVVVGLAYQVASGFIYLYADGGATVSSNSTSILIVLMFGVGTDYCLLLVSRYREELHRIEDKHEAMQRALRRAGPALLASGCTVIAAMLVLLLAEGGSTKSLGPVSAIGVAARAAGRAHAAAGAADRRRAARLLAAQRHRGVQAAGGDSRATAGCGGASATSSCAGRGSRWRRPRRSSRSARSGLLVYQEDYSIGGFFKKDVESVEGFEVLGRSFPAGALGPTAVIVRREGGAATDADVAAARERVQGIEGVARVSPRARPIGGRRGSRGSTSSSATTRTQTPRWLASTPCASGSTTLPPGVDALVGAGSAVQADFNDAAERDLRVIVPVALLVIAIILGVLLRAVVAPIVLIATVVRRSSARSGCRSSSSSRCSATAAWTRRCRPSRSSSSSRSASTTRSSS